MSASVWKKVRFESIGMLAMCKRVFQHETKSEGEIPFFKIGTFGRTPDAYISSELFEHYKKTFSYPEKGDILISASGTIGRTVIFDGKPSYFQDSNIIWLEHNEKKILNEFLFHLYKTIIWNLEGSTIKRLYTDNFNKIEITIPQSLAEQKHISDILSSCDSVIQSTQKVIDKYKAIKQGMMHDLFTRGLTEDGKLRPSYQEAPELYKLSELGMIPKEWEVKTTNDLAKRLWIGLVTTMTSHYVDKGVPLIRNSDITENKIEEVEIFLDYEFANLNASREVHKGDVVTVHTGEIGTSAVIDDKYDGAHGFATINTTVNKSFISEEYYCRYMNSEEFKRQAFRAITGDGRQNLNIYDFVNLLIPYSICKSEQIAIAKRLSSIDSAIQKEDAMLAKYKNIKTGLMARLLTPPQDAQIIDETEE